ncbi:MAG TPA: DUF2298 domain-containing protein [Thermomicrobiaceae bacterium]|nr:DUF2298 domain-containing protein [Thermomicrobiaceae bacterium]
MSTPSPRRLLFLATAGLILVAAFGLRDFGHNWDSGWYLQPDERFIALVLTDRIHMPSLNHLGVLLDAAHSPLNPRADGPNGQPQSFAYGSLPLYVTDVTAWAAGHVTGQDLNTYAEIGSVGRYLTAAFDTATVALVMLFAVYACGRLSSLLAGILLATSVMVIQLAHFLTTDAWVTFFATAALLASLRLWQTGRRRWAVLAGIAVGAALATKISVVSLALPVALAIVAPPPGETWRRPGRHEVVRALLSAVAALVTFAVFEPYALLSPGPFIADAQMQWSIVTGKFDVPYTRQYVGTIPVVYQLLNLVHWGLGPALALAAIAAVIVALRRQFRRVRVPDLILLAWALPYFALIATAQAKFMRYVEPIVPALVLLAAIWLSEMVQSSGPRTWRRRLSIALIAIVVVQTALWAAAFEAIYTVPHTRVAASEWIFQHVPSGSTITAEYWDDALPLPLSGHGLTSYHVLTMDLYADRPNQQALDYIANDLKQANYIILSSNRLARSIPRLPWRYPVTSEYYRLLEGGQLGFRLVYEGTDFPRLGPFVFNDQWVDESFRVYDHPVVRIYQKVDTLSTAQLDARFAAALTQPWSPTRAAPPGNLSLGQPVGTLPAAHDLGWSSQVTNNQVIAIIVWLVALTLIGAVGLPLSLTLFRAFPDLGWGFARVVGLLAVAYLVWIAVSLGVARFTVWTIVVGIALVAAAFWWGLHRRTIEALREARRRHRLVVAAELVFLLAFLGFLFLRSLNPDLWQTYFGGEKPMEMAYTSAIARSATFPPYDPWYAGGVMNYYYYGFYLVALLWKLTGIQPEIAFQLAIATVGGLLAAAAFSLTTALATNLHRLKRARWQIAAGLLGVLVYIGVGNLDAATQVLQSRSLTVDFWQSRSVVDYAITEFPYFSLIWADLHPHVIVLPLTVLLLALAYAWVIRRPDDPGRLPAWLWVGTTGVVLGSIAVTNSWDLPISALVVAAAQLYGAVRGHTLRLRPIVTAVLRAAVVGGLAWLCFAPFFTRFVALVSGVKPTQWGTPLGEYFVHFGLYLGVLGLLAVTLAFTRWRAERSDPLRLAYGAVAALAAFVVALFAGNVAITDARHVLFSVALAMIVSGALTWLVPMAVAAVVDARWGVVAAVLASLVIGVLATSRPTGAFLVAVMVGASALWLRLRERPAAGFAALCVAGAALVTLVADLVYVVDDLSGSAWERMNTVFKFYMEGWTLYALAAGLALTWLLRQAYREHENAPLGLIAGPRRGVARDDVGGMSSGFPVATYAVALSSVLIVAALAYPVLATGPRLSQRMPGSPTSPSLDGLAWMKHSYITNSLGQPIEFGGDYAAIQWLRQNATGIPVILEASIGPYRGNGSRISAGTGFPDVLGWDSHELQQRYAPGIEQRLHDVREIYVTTDINLKLQLLRQYQVRYIVVGDVERLWTVPPGYAGISVPGPYYATSAGLDAFNQMVGTSLRVAFHSGHTTIYEVLPTPSLPPAPGARVTS